MSLVKTIFDLIAKQQACSIDALVIATGHDTERVAAAIDRLRREGLIQRGAEYRPAVYSATFGVEPPRPVGRPRGPRLDAVTEAIRTQPNSVFALGASA